MNRPDESASLSAYPVWDPAVRASHWALAVLLPWQLLTGYFGWWPSFHVWTGYALLAVVLFRVLWGWVGSESARFGALLAGPVRIGQAFAELARRRPGRHAGHNPVGALSVLLILALLLAQSLTGLFFESWGDVRGPLAERVSRETAVWLSDLHGLLFWPLLILVCIHVAAGFHHLLWKGENRLGAIFLHGRLNLPADPALKTGGRTRAGAALLIALLVVAAIAWFGPIV